ncbi:MAG: peptidylprolyl isomerase [Ignavibacteria bacterium]|nr:peptidylprolyl isomerase [Ignavibacteria bacterium]
MAAASKGHRVSVHYTGSLDDGSVFDSSRGGAPFAFTLGKGEVIPGFDAAVMGLEVGGTVTVTIPAAQAYGEYSEQYVLRAKRSDIPPEIVPEIGMELTIHQDDGSSVPVRVTELSPTHVTLDANHPLAGKALTFEIELLSVEG